MVDRFRTKPVSIEAMQYTGENGAELWDWAGSEHFGWNHRGQLVALIDGSEYTISPYDWVIRMDDGRVYPCTPEIFAATYEPEGKP